MLITEPSVAIAALATLIVGAGVGVLVGVPRARGTRVSAAAVAVITLVPAGVSMLGLVPGRQRLWLDLASTLLLAYLVGCVAGCSLAVARGR